MSRFYYFILFVFLYSCDKQIVVKPKAKDIYSYIKDKNGNTYKIIKIGNQTWMVENLKSTKCVYKEGYKKQEKDDIRTLLPSDTSMMYFIDTNKYAPYSLQWPYNGVDTFSKTYGRLYTWPAVKDQRNICPTGWRIPSVQDWEKIISFLGGYELAGGKMKEVSSYWSKPNTDASNTSFFSARGGAYRNEYGYFTPLLKSGYWWTSTEDDEDTSSAFAYSLNASSGKIFKVSKLKKQALSVRCIL